MNLKELMEQGAVIDQGYVTKNVKWTDTEATNGPKSFDFDIEVKKEMSVADFEFIHFKDGAETDPSYAARRMHRLVRLAGDSVPLDSAKTFKVGLLAAIGKVLPNANLGETPGND